MKKDIEVFLRKYLLGIKIYVIVTILISILIEACGLAISYLISMSVDFSIKSHAMKDLVPLLGGIICIIVLNGILTLLKIWVSEHAGWNIKNSLRIRMLEKCTKMKSEASKYINNGEMLELIENDTNVIYSFFTEQFVSIVTSIMIIVLILIILLKKNILIAIYELAFATFAGMFLYHFKEKNYEIRAKCRAEQVEISGFEGEIYEALDDIRGNNLASEIMEQYKMKLANFFPLHVKAEKTKWVTFMVLLLIRTVGIGTCLLVSMYLLSRGEISLGVLYLFYQYTQYIIYPLNILQQYLKEKQGIDISVERVMNMLNYEEENLNEGEQKKNNCYDVQFENVSFSYSNDKEILKNIDLHIPDGKICGIGGRTGNGKSTLVSLLVKLYNPNNGRILIGGEDISTLNTEFLRKCILYIPQDSTMFHSTLRDNISLFDKTLSDDKMKSAIRSLGLENWYNNKFLQGLDTVFQDENELSAGEKQLISIIRAYIVNPPILVFDEITAKVDPDTENKIFDALIEIMKGKTCIIISHNQKLKKIYDMYFELEEGELAWN